MRPPVTVKSFIVPEAPGGQRILSADGEFSKTESFEAMELSRKIRDGFPAFCAYNHLKDITDEINEI